MKCAFYNSSFYKDFSKTSHAALVARGCKIWTDEEREQIKSLYRDGLTYDQIAAHFGVSRGSIAKQILVLGLSSRNKPFSPYEKDYVRKHHKSKSYKQIAEDLGRSHDAIRRLGVKLGFHHRHGESHRLSKFSDSDVELIRQMHEEGFSIIDISLKMEVSYGHVSDIVNYNSRCYVAMQ